MLRGMGRFDVLRPHRAARPGADYAEIYRLMGTREFPWDMNQALSFALFRTYAVPSIGALLARTGELTERTQKRYDDTVLILDAVLEHGMDSERGPDGDPADEPDAPLLRHQQRRPPLRAGHLRRDPDPLDGRVRLAADDRGRADRERELLPRPRPADGHPGHPRDLAGVRPAARRLRARPLRASTPAAARWPRPPSRCWPRSRPTTGSRSRVVRRISLATMDDALLDAFAFPHPSPGDRAAWSGAALQGARAGGPVPPAAHRALLRPTAAAGAQLSRRVPGGGPRHVPGRLPGAAPRAAERAGPPRKSEPAHPKGTWQFRFLRLWSCVPGNDGRSGAGGGRRWT